MKINIRSNIKEFTKNIKHLDKREIPYIQYIAINNTAKRVVEKEKSATRQYLDKPTPAVQKSIFIKEYAKKGKQIAVMGFRDWAEKFMKLQIMGGMRSDRTHVPTPSMHLNKYGNIPGRRTGIIKGKRFFLQQGNTSGVWEIRGSGANKKLTLLAKLKESTQYDAIFPYFDIAINNAKKIIRQEFVNVAKRVYMQKKYK